MAKRRVIKRLREGRMTRWARRLGYIRKGQRVSDIPYRKIDDFARDLARRVGPTTAQRMFQVQVLFRKRRPRDPFRRKMERAVRAVQAWRERRRKGR